ncbi:membrane protein [Nocardia callitridis]|uniref:Membrane protein n=1 Tax=Nocardia callitridis TaxID=648753 RepID=A0ABP9L1H6_9NOCA
MLAVIIAVGPVTVAASMFPATTRKALAAPDNSTTILTVLHRICRVYAGLGVLVPIFGALTALTLGVLTDTWLIISIGLTAAAGGVLAMMILPSQRTVLGDLTATTPLTLRRLATDTGVFNLLWVAVTVLMIVRPGSTTGA